MSNPASLSSYSWPVGLKTLGRPPLSFGPLDVKCLVVLSAEAEAEQVNFLPARFASGSTHRQNSMQSERWKLGATFGVIFHQHAMPPWSVLLPDGVGRGCRCRFRFGASLACNTYGRSTTFGWTAPATDGPGWQTGRATDLAGHTVVETHARCFVLFGFVSFYHVGMDVTPFCPWVSACGCGDVSPCIAAHGAQCSA